MAAIEEKQTPAIELKTVNDTHWVGEPDVLWPKVAMSVPADRKTAISLHQRHHGLIHIGSQPAIERQFGPACRFATIKSRKIQVGKANGLLQLDDVLTCQKNPPHVSLAWNDGGHGGVPLPRINNHKPLHQEALSRRSNPAPGDHRWG